MSSDSIERLCDDFLKDILEYLSFADKVKYECLSHQWQRCLYSRQTVLVIDGSDQGLECPAFDSLNSLVVKTRVDDVSNRVTVLRKDSFESVLQKCRAIKKLVIIGCECDDEVLRLIADNCPFLEDIECELIRVNPHHNCLIEFGQKLGKRLKKFRFTYFTIDFEIVKSLLSSCLKLEAINCDILEAVVDRRPEFLPKLNNLRVRVRPSDETHFEMLAEMYAKGVKPLRCLALYGSSQCFPSALKHIATIVSLQSLTFDLSSDISSDRLVSDMKLMAENLKNLKTLVINSIVFISDQFFNTLGHFKSLRKLAVNQNILFVRSNADISVSQLNGCQFLKELTINGFNFTEHFFDDISLYLPQLTSIQFSLMTDNVITNRLFRSIQCLELLERFSFALIVNKSKKLNVSSLQTLMSQLVCITDNGLSELIRDSPKLRIIELKDTYLPIVAQKTLDAVVDKAKAHKKLRFVFELRSEKLEMEQTKTLCKANLPDNLLVRLFNKQESSKTHN